MSALTKILGIFVDSVRGLFGGERESERLTIDIDESLITRDEITENKMTDKVNKMAASSSTESPVGPTSTSGWETCVEVPQTNSQISEKLKKLQEKVAERSDELIRSRSEVDHAIDGKETERDQKSKFPNPETAVTRDKMISKSGSVDDKRNYRRIRRAGDGRGDFRLLSAEYGLPPTQEQIYRRKVKKVKWSRPKWKKSSEISFKLDPRRVRQLLRECMEELRRKTPVIDADEIKEAMPVETILPKESQSPVAIKVVEKEDEENVVSSSNSSLSSDHLDRCGCDGDEGIASSQSAPLVSPKDDPDTTVASLKSVPELLDESTGSPIQSFGKKSIKLTRRPLRPSVDSSNIEAFSAESSSSPSDKSPAQSDSALHVRRNSLADLFVQGKNLKTVYSVCETSSDTPVSPTESLQSRRTSEVETAQETSQMSSSVSNSPKSSRPESRMSSSKDVNGKQDLLEILGSPKAPSKSSPTSENPSKPDGCRNVTTESKNSSNSGDHSEKSHKSSRSSSKDSADQPSKKRHRSRDRRPSRSEDYYKKSRKSHESSSSSTRRHSSSGECSSPSKGRNSSKSPRSSHSKPEDSGESKASESSKDGSTSKKPTQIGCSKRPRVSRLSSDTPDAQYSSHVKENLQEKLNRVKLKSEPKKSKRKPEDIQKSLAILFGEEDEVPSKPENVSALGGDHSIKTSGRSSKPSNRNSKTAEKVLETVQDEGLNREEEIAKIWLAANSGKCNIPKKPVSTSSPGDYLQRKRFKLDKENREMEKKALSEVPKPASAVRPKNRMPAPPKPQPKPSDPPPPDPQVLNANIAIDEEIFQELEDEPVPLIEAVEKALEDPNKTEGIPKITQIKEEIPFIGDDYGSQGTESMDLDEPEGLPDLRSPHSVDTVIMDEASKSPGRLEIDEREQCIELPPAPITIVYKVGDNGEEKTLKVSPGESFLKPPRARNSTPSILEKVLEKRVNVDDVRRLLDEIKSKSLDDSQSQAKVQGGPAPEEINKIPEKKLEKFSATVSESVKGIVPTIVDSPKVDMVAIAVGEPSHPSGVESGLQEIFNHQKQLFERMFELMRVFRYRMTMVERNPVDMDLGRLLNTICVAVRAGFMKLRGTMDGATDEEVVKAIIERYRKTNETPVITPEDILTALRQSRVAVVEPVPAPVVPVMEDGVKEERMKKGKPGQDVTKREGGGSDGGMNHQLLDKHNSSDQRPPPYPGEQVHVEPRTSTSNIPIDHKPERLPRPMPQFHPQIPFSTSQTTTHACTTSSVTLSTPQNTSHTLPTPSTTLPTPQNTSHKFSNSSATLPTPQSTSHTYPTCSATLPTPQNTCPTFSTPSTTLPTPQNTCHTLPNPFGTLPNPQKPKKSTNKSSKPSRTVEHKPPLPQQPFPPQPPLPRASNPPPYPHQSNSQPMLIPSMQHYNPFVVQSANHLVHPQGQPQQMNSQDPLHQQQFFHHMNQQHPFPIPSQLPAEFVKCATGGCEHNNCERYLQVQRYQQMLQQTQNAVGQSGMQATRDPRSRSHSQQLQTTPGMIQVSLGGVPVQGSGLPGAYSRQGPHQAHPGLSRAYPGQGPYQGQPGLLGAYSGQGPHQGQPGFPGAYSGQGPHQGQPGFPGAYSGQGPHQGHLQQSNPQQLQPHQLPNHHLLNMQSMTQNIGCQYFDPRQANNYLESTESKKRTLQGQMQPQMVQGPSKQAKGQLQQQLNPYIQQYMVPITNSPMHQGFKPPEISQNSPALGSASNAEVNFESGTQGILSPRTPFEALPRSAVLGTLGNQSGVNIGSQSAPQLHSPGVQGFNHPQMSWNSPGTAGNRAGVNVGSTVSSAGNCGIQGAPAAGGRQIGIAERLALNTTQSCRISPAGSSAPITSVSADSAAHFVQKSEGISMSVTPVTAGNYRVSSAIGQIGITGVPRSSPGMMSSGISPNVPQFASSGISRASSAVNSQQMPPNSYSTVNICISRSSTGTTMNVHQTGSTGVLQSSPGGSCQPKPSNSLQTRANIIPTFSPHMNSPQMSANAVYIRATGIPGCSPHGISQQMPTGSPQSGVIGDFRSSAQIKQRATGIQQSSSNVDLSRSSPNVPRVSPAGNSPGTLGTASQTGIMGTPRSTPGPVSQGCSLNGGIGMPRRSPEINSPGVPVPAQQNEPLRPSRPSSLPDFDILLGRTGAGGASRSSPSVSTTSACTEVTGTILPKPSPVPSQKMPFSSRAQKKLVPELLPIGNSQRVPLLPEDHIALTAVSTTSPAMNSPRIIQPGQPTGFNVNVVTSSTGMTAISSSYSDTQEALATMDRIRRTAIDDFKTTSGESTSTNIIPQGHLTRLESPGDGATVPQVPGISPAPSGVTHTRRTPTPAAPATPQETRISPAPSGATHTRRTSTPAAPATPQDTRISPAIRQATSYPENHTNVSRIPTPAHDNLLINQSGRVPVSDELPASPGSPLDLSTKPASKPSKPVIISDIKIRTPNSEVINPPESGIPGRNSPGAVQSPSSSFQGQQTSGVVHKIEVISLESSDEEEFPHSPGRENPICGEIPEEVKEENGAGNDDLEIVDRSKGSFSFVDDEIECNGMAKQMGIRLESSSQGVEDIPLRIEGVTSIPIDQYESIDNGEEPHGEAILVKEEMMENLDIYEEKPGMCVVCKKELAIFSCKSCHLAVVCGEACALKTDHFDFCEPPLVKIEDD